MPEFQHHLFVCGNQRRSDHPRGCCDCDGGGALRAAFKAAIAEVGLVGVRANHAGCLDQCEMGPVVVIYPEGIWYGGVHCDDVPRIVRSTLIQGKVLEDLRIPAEALNTKGAHPWRPAGSRPEKDGLEERDGQ